MTVCSLQGGGGLYPLPPKSLKVGSPVSYQSHPRPQSIRHGFVREIRGKFALVKFHGRLPMRIPLGALKGAE